MIAQLTRVFAVGMLLCGFSLFPVQAVEFDQEKLMQWADNYFGPLIDEHRMSGAGIAFVKDGKLLFSKGYGYEDAAKRIPFDPKQTKVRVCSNSKVIVATALLQLVDSGVIESLEDPANNYLKRFQLPVTSDKNVTIKDLLTHRTGYGSAGFGAGTDQNVPVPVSGNVYERLLPSVNVTPGEVSSYANAALAVQGALIEDQTGRLLGDYLQERIFQPYGMEDTLYHYETEVPERLAIPYRFYPDGSLEEVPFFAKHPVFAPSGGVISTVNDMAKFAIWHADEGRTRHNTVLKPETYLAMHTEQVANHPSMSGLGYQFFTDSFNGERMIQHGCGLPGFNTRLAIFPDSNAGFFISSVSADKRLTVAESLQMMLTPERMVPKDGCCMASNVTSHTAYQKLLHFLAPDRAEHALKVPLPTEQRHNLRDYEGTYMLYRSIQGTILKVVGALFTREVEVGEEGLIVQGKGPYLEVAPDLFQHKIEGGSKFAFVRDENGHVFRMLWNSSGSAYKLGFFNNPFNFHTSILYLLIFSVTGLFAFAWPKKTQQQHLAAWLPAILVAMLIISALAILAGFDGAGPIYSIKEYLNVGRTGRLWLLALAGNIMAFSILAMTWFTFKAFREVYWGTGIRAWLRRVHYMAITIVGLVTLIFLYVFNLVGFYIP